MILELTAFASIVATVVILLQWMESARCADIAVIVKFKTVAA